MKEIILGTSLVVQWFRIYLTGQGVWVRSQVRELRPYMPQSNSGASTTEAPLLWNLWRASTTEPLCPNWRVHTPQWDILLDVTKILCATTKTPLNQIHKQTLKNETTSSPVQSLSCVRLFATPWIAACQASLSITNSRSSPKLMSVESVMPSNHLILCRPLLHLPSIFPSIRVFSNESVLFIRWPKYWSFSFSISPFNKYLGLIAFRMDWLDLLAVQGTLKSLLQHHSSKASILRPSAFFIVQLSNSYMTTGKNYSFD